MPRPNQGHQIEQRVRAAFNTTHAVQTRKQRLIMPGGHARHEFDLYDEGRVIGGVSTSPWRNLAKEGKRRTYNTAGQDRATTEIFWLSHWKGAERRIHILTDEDMADKLYGRLRAIPMLSSVDVLRFNLQNDSFTVIGSLGI